MSINAIEVTNIKKKFSGVSALEDVNFSINQGEIFGFLGPSGSGKTTTINILTGQLKSDHGKAKMFGEDIQNMKTDMLENIGIVSDQSGYYDKLSLYKNLQLYAKLYGKKNNVVDKLLKNVDLYDSRNKLAEELSTGMKQRMLLARALINNPKILFLDEPTSGLDPYTSQKIHKLLLDLKKQGTTIFLTTHDMYEATLLCDNLVLLNRGKIVEYGTPNSIINKHHKNKTVNITYTNGEESNLSISDLDKLNYLNKEISSIHSTEPTLEDIFIKLTGEKLNEKN